MTEENKGDQLSGFAPIEGFFTQTPSEPRKRPTDHLYLAILRQIQQRHKILGTHFSSSEKLEAYIGNHKAKELIRRRIKSIVAANSREIARLSEQKSEKKNPQSDVSMYWALVVNNYVEVSKVFQEIPENIGFCDYGKLAKWYAANSSKTHNSSGDKDKVLEALNGQWKSRRAYIQNRWNAITGREHSIDSAADVPALDEVDRWKAPIPYRPSWSNALYSLEANQMMHRSAIGSSAFGRQTGTTEYSSTSDLTGNPDSDTSEGVGSNEGCLKRLLGGIASLFSSSSNQQDNGDLRDGNYANSNSPIEDLYTLAGGKIPKQPSSGPDGKLYTFPGTLRRHENTYYDYSLIIPIEDCGPCKNESEATYSRNLLAAKVLVGKAKTVLKFLSDIGLSQVLGKYGDKEIVADIELLLEAILEISAATSVNSVRRRKRRLREMAGLMRLLARTEMFLTGLQEGSDPKQFLEALRTAIRDFPAYDLKSTQMPTTNENQPLRRNTLYFPNENQTYYGRENINNNVNIPDAYWYDYNYYDPGSPGGWEWWVAYEQRHDLRNYVIYLGDVFYQRLNALVGSSRDMRDAVTAFSGGYAQFQTDFERLASGVVNNAALALGHLLDEIAEQITLPQKVNVEGSKRLALQVIFRQYWHPDGYVMGKLVGYKNLIPNQRETLHRRTFVRTITEMTTAEEYASARQDDYSQSQKETAEVIRETSRDFDFTQNASGHFDVGIWGVESETEIGLSLGQKSKSVQTMVSEATMKGSAKYSDRREVKVRELTEVEDVQEVTTELANLNQEITANYFYYQLLRQYRVTIELHDLRPVLLRTRDIPTPAEIDDKFISTHIHILIHCLPNQLAVDAQESTDQLDVLGRTLIRRRAEMDQRAAEFEIFKNQPPPPPDNQAEYNQYRQELQSKERILSEARQEFIEIEEQYTRIQARLNRVVTHIRRNLCHYMQFIWQASPKTDEDKLLQNETFCREPLPRVTRGLIRQGYFGNEVIFDYTGRSIALFDLIVSNLTPGSEIASLPVGELRETALFQYLSRYYPNQAEILLEQIRSSAFVTDPIQPEEVLSSRSVQIPQDALVVETMPGEVPLLEGFQMAHRMLDVRRADLENTHLKERIKDRPWKAKGDDTYEVRRYEGDVPQQGEVSEQL